MKILVTGGTGMVGFALSNLQTDHEIVCVGSRDYNLVNTQDAEEMIKTIKPDVILHLAAQVGGIKANIDRPADFYYNNIMINTNVLHSAYKYNIKKVVAMLSTCIFPNDVKYPLREENIHSGHPHDSNFSYAYAKRMIDIQSRAYRAQHDCNFVTVVPNNLFGENDNFHKTQSHVIPGMIRKFYDAVLSSRGEVKLWGDGTPLREFTYSKDVASQLIFILEEYDNDDPINIGCGKEVSIKKLSQMIAKEVGYSGEITWDNRMPVGQLRKPSDKSKLASLGWDMDRETKLTEAIKRTVAWYKENYPDVRGVN